MTHIHQPKRSKLCGHACVAMAAGVSLADAISAIGHRKATRVTDLTKALRVLGVRCSDFLEIVQDDTDFPDLYIAQVKYPRRRNWHWVLFAHGAMYDPSQISVPPVGRVNAILRIKARP